MALVVGGQREQPKTRTAKNDHLYTFYSSI